MQSWSEVSMMKIIKLMTGHNSLFSLVLVHLFLVVH